MGRTIISIGGEGASHLSRSPLTASASPTESPPGLPPRMRRRRRPLDALRERQGPRGGALRFVRVLGARVQAARDQRVVQAAERLPDEPQFFGREAWHA
jgi:hypothetical protein